MGFQPVFVRPQFIENLRRETGYIPFIQLIPTAEGFDLPAMRRVATGIRGASTMASTRMGHLEILLKQYEVV